VVEALGRAGGGDPQPPCGEVAVPTESCVLGHHGGVYAPAAGERPSGLSVQQGRPTHRRPGDQSGPDQVVAEPQPPGGLHQQAAADRALGVGEHIQGAAAEDARKQVDVQLFA